MPGYFCGEFYHNAFGIARIQAGAPLSFWSARIQPGFNILYMPRDNDVIGMADYSRRTYRSVSLELSMKAGGVLPLFFNYAYGIDARRLDTGTGVVKTGSHEFILFMVAGF